MIIKNHYDAWNNIWNNTSISLPWDVQGVDHNLASYIEKYNGSADCALEVGCGSGINSIFLGEKFKYVLGIDIAEEAIKRSIQKKTENSTNVNFMQKNFFEFECSKKFNFIFDRGCYHGIQRDSYKHLFLEKIFHSLDDNGMWLSLIGSKNCLSKDVNGPPKQSLKEIVNIFEKYLRILEIKESFIIDTNNNKLPFWYILSRKSLFL